MAIEFIRERLTEGLTGQIADVTLQASEAYRAGDVDEGRRLLEKATGLNQLLATTDDNLRAIDDTYIESGLPKPPVEILYITPSSPAQPAEAQEPDPIAASDEDEFPDDTPTQRFPSLFSNDATTDLGSISTEITEPEGTPNEPPKERSARRNTQTIPFTFPDGFTLDMSPREIELAQHLLEGSTDHATINTVLSNGRTSTVSYELLHRLRKRLAGSPWNVTTVIPTPQGKAILGLQSEKTAITSAHEPLTQNADPLSPFIDLADDDTIPIQDVPAGSLILSSIPLSERITPMDSDPFADDYPIDPAPEPESDSEPGSETHPQANLDRNKKGAVPQGHRQYTILRAVLRPNETNSGTANTSRTAIATEAIPEIVTLSGTAKSKRLTSGRAQVLNMTGGNLALLRLANEGIESPHLTNALSAIKNEFPIYSNMTLRDMARIVLGIEPFPGMSLSNTTPRSEESRIEPRTTISREAISAFQLKLINIIFALDTDGRPIHATNDDILRAFFGPKFDDAVENPTRSNNPGKLKGELTMARKSLIRRIMAINNGENLHKSWPEALSSAFQNPNLINLTQDELISFINRELTVFDGNSMTPGSISPIPDSQPEPTPKPERPKDTKIEPFGDKQIALLQARFSFNEDGTFTYDSPQSIAAILYPERAEEAFREPDKNKRDKLYRRIMEDYEKTIKGIEVRIRSLIDNTNAAIPQNVEQFISSIAGNPLTATLDIGSLISIIKSEPGFQNLIKKPDGQVVTPPSPVDSPTEDIPLPDKDIYPHEFADGETLHVPDKDLARLLAVFSTQDSWTLEELAKKFTNDSSRSGQRTTYVALERLKTFLANSSNKRLKVERGIDSNDHQARHKIVDFSDQPAQETSSTETPAETPTDRTTSQAKHTRFESGRPTTFDKDRKPLSSIERQMLHMMRERIPDSRIATSLKMTPQRFKEMRDGIYSNLGSSQNYDDAVRRAIELGELRAR